ncbi:siphovirus Gp157 family protein [Gallibacterium anatis]|uniref:siphovirus Gp157 family protein n=1 Tax=Gallibacterium anatis TaxID=750 RepID=UPI00300510DD
MSLYGLSERLKNINELLDDEEFTNEQAVIDCFNNLEMEFSAKIEEVYKHYKEIDLLAKNAKEEKQRIETIQKSYESRKQRIRNLIYAAMANSEIKKVETPILKLTMTKPIPSSLKIDDNAKIPDNFFIMQEPKLDLSGLKEAVKNGLQIDGVELISKPQLRGL